MSGVSAGDGQQTMSGTIAHTRLVQASGPGAAPTRWMMFLHGILGSGGNWRTMARRILDERAAAGDPSWGAILVDLRQHGRSQGFAEPHTVAACARDLEAIDAAYPEPIEAIVAHSFGGKVALAYVEEHGGRLDEAWILDSTPSARLSARGSETTLHVVSVLESLPPTFASRAAFDQALIAHGLDGAARAGLRQWLATNVERVDASYRLRLHLPDVRALLEDYFHVDMWNVIAHPPGRVRLHLVIAERSNVLSEADRTRADREALAHPDRIFVDRIPEAGHWLHVDAPDALVALIGRDMGARSVAK